ncbi:MAG: cytochrome c [Bacteroidota bacterium]|nr:cytochrome c [Bacteroidota bacterium]
MQVNDEIDFIELLKNPIRLFGLTYIYFLSVAGFLGAYYLWNMNDVSKNGIAPVVLKDSTQFVQDISMQRGALIPPVNVAEVGKSSKVLVDKGANLFKANCASCHGDNGMGDGPSGASMAVKPRNFHSAEGWKNGRKVSNMYKTLQDGIVQNGMQSFNYLPAEDRFAIIHFVRTFANDFPLDSSSELMDLEKAYNLSQGSQLPPRIPVRLAMLKIEQESMGDSEYVIGVSKSIGAAKQDDLGGALAHRFCVNNTKIAAALYSLKDKNVDEFIRIISIDPVTLGFKSEVTRLSREEWNALYSYFSKINKKS